MRTHAIRVLISFRVPISCLQHYLRMVAATQRLDEMQASSASSRCSAG